MNKQLLWIHPLFWISYLILYTSTLRITHLELLSYQDLRHHQNHCLILGSSPLYHWHQYSSPFWSPTIRITTFSTTVTLLKINSLHRFYFIVCYYLKIRNPAPTRTNTEFCALARICLSTPHISSLDRKRIFLCVFGARQRQWIQRPQIYVNMYVVSSTIVYCELLVFNVDSKLIPWNARNISWEPSIPFSMIIKIAYLMYDVIFHNTAMQYQIY